MSTQIIALFNRKKKKVMKEKRKLRDKMALNMIIPGDTMQVTDDLELFNIKKIKKKNVSYQYEAAQFRAIPILILHFSRYPIHI